MTWDPFDDAPQSSRRIPKSKPSSAKSTSGTSAVVSPPLQLPQPPEVQFHLREGLHPDMVASLADFQRARRGVDPPGILTTRCYLEGMSSEADTLASPLKFTIHGIPYSKLKRTGKKEGRQDWVDAIQEQTSKCPLVRTPCELEVEFLLPPDKFPADLPSGPDLDNLLELFMDGLLKHVLQNDSLVIRLVASKRRVEAANEAGAVVTLRPPQWAITEQLNRSLGEGAVTLDRRLAAMQRLTLQQEPW